MFKDWSDEQIISYMEEKDAKKSEETIITVTETDDKDYDKKFKKMLSVLNEDYTVDMNNSNDAQALMALARHLIQAEKADQRIRAIQDKPVLTDDDVRTLKNLGDYQSGVQRTINDLQDKLGISRKLRKEKQADDIPQYIAGLQKKAKDFWDRKTVGVKCGNCQIELSRYWINFPNLAYTVKMELECWKCHEKIIYTI
jgi:NADH dehydrogenase/NADH:ubiquinone oxidoreductase subunit G